MATTYDVNGADLNLIVSKLHELPGLRKRLEYGFIEKIAINWAIMDRFKSSRVENTIC